MGAIMTRAQTFRAPSVIFTASPTLRIWSVSTGPQSPAANGRVIQTRLRNPADTEMRLVLGIITAWSNVTRRLIVSLGESASDLATVLSQRVRQSNMDFRSARARASLNNNLIVANGLSGFFEVSLEGNVPKAFYIGALIEPKGALDVYYNETGDSLATDILKLNIDYEEIPLRELA